MAERQVVVVGSGAAGCAAAVAAAREGARVTWLERASKLGGTTSYSGAVAWIPAHHCAQPRGVTDSPAEALRYLRSVGLGDSDPALAEVFVREGPRVLRATESATLLRWRVVADMVDYHAELDGGKPDGGRCLEITTFKAGRAAVAAVRPNPYPEHPPVELDRMVRLTDLPDVEQLQREGYTARGQGYVAGMYLAAQDLGVDVRPGRRATSLLFDRDAVRGVEADGEVFAGAVIFATGGFEREAGLVRTFLRGPMVAPGSPPTNQGDALRMGMNAGAALGNMSEAWWCPAFAVPGETIDGAPLYRMFFTDRAKPGGLIVDSRGHRFANEAANYSDFGRSLHAFDPTHYSYPRARSWYVFDGARRADFQIGPLQPADPDPAWLLRAATLDELARLMDVPPEHLRASVERYNSHAARGTDEDFGRGSYPFDRYAAGTSDPALALRPVTHAPFYALRVLAGCLGTNGGLKTNGHGQVVRADESGPIPGLYAAGNTAASIFGHSYTGGGATVGQGMVFGWLAGEHAAQG